MSLRMALIIAKEIQIRCLFDETQAIPSRNMNNAMLFEDNKDADSLQLHGNNTADNIAFVFALEIIHYIQNLKLQASNFYSKSNV